MSKPPGVTLTMDHDGPRLSVTRSSAAEDAIWQAVQEAILRGWTPAQFIAEARESWAHELRENAKEADDGFRDA